MDERTARTACATAYVLFLAYAAALLWCAYRRYVPARAPAPVLRLVPVAVDTDEPKPPREPPARPASPATRKRKD